MTSSIFAAALSGALLLMTAAPSLGQPRGGPPEEVFVEASRAADGTIALSQSAVALTRGAYYRLNFVCKDGPGGAPAFDFDTARLVRDSHLRVMGVDNMEVYLQGLSFRSIQCEGPGALRFSFYPMRPGQYEIAISDEEAEGVSALLAITVE